LYDDPVIPSPFLFPTKSYPCLLMKDSYPHLSHFLNWQLFHCSEDVKLSKFYFSPPLSYFGVLSKEIVTCGVILSDAVSRVLSIDLPYRECH